MSAKPDSKPCLHGKELLALYLAYNFTNDFQILIHNYYYKCISY